MSYNQNKILKFSRFSVLSINLMLILVSFSEGIIACTAFSFGDNKSVYVGKNLDWPIGVGYIFINKKNVLKSSLRIDDSPPIEWVSKYGSITFNQLGKEFPLGGINEAGLVVEELSNPVSKYPEDRDKSALNELQWIQYQLDNSANVSDVIKSSNVITISRLLFSVHYFICDQNGDAAIIESINGNLIIYTRDNLPFRVLSNNSYENSLRYLKMHEGFGGDLPIVDGRAGSQERFIRTVKRLENSNYKRNPPIEYAYEILDDVAQGDTQWSIVYDLGNLCVSIKTKSSRNIIECSLKDFSLDNLKPVKIADILSQEAPVQFRNFTPQENEKLQADVIKILIETGDLSETGADKLLNQLTNYINTIDY